MKATTSARVRYAEPITVADWTITTHNHGANVAIAFNRNDGLQRKLFLSLDNADLDALYNVLQRREKDEATTRTIFEHQKREGN